MKNLSCINIVFDKFAEKAQAKSRASANHAVFLTKNVARIIAQIAKKPYR
jgi:hypothetical protein